MILFNNIYATVWSVEDKGNYVKGRISTSEKNKEGEYVNSNWFVTFVGKAKEPALALSTRDRIKIISGKISNTTTGEGKDKKSFVNVVIFDFEKLNTSNNNNATNDMDDLPF
jgi:hypothetical protein